MGLASPSGRRRWSLVLGSCLGWFAAFVSACPVGEADPNSDVLLVVLSPGHATVSFRAGDLAALPPTQLAQKKVLSSATGGSTEQSLAYGGVLLRDVLKKAGVDEGRDRRTRLGVVEAIATDGYRASFSWGELFNSPAGEQILVIATQDGRQIDTSEGPLALRALGDVRPGPRHVRNLCALRFGGLTDQ
jgi:hypothetical protein